MRWLWPSSCRSRSEATRLSYKGIARDQTLCNTTALGCRVANAERVGNRSPLQHLLHSHASEDVESAAVICTLIQSLHGLKKCL